MLSLHWPVPVPEQAAASEQSTLLCLTASSSRSLKVPQHIHSDYSNMYVVKRDGRHETVEFDKITARIKKLVSVYSVSGW